MKYYIPGYIGVLIMTLLISLWTFWAAGEMYYEGWWGAWYNRLPYWGASIILLVLTLIAIKWSKIGGWILIILGTGFFIWWMSLGGFALNRFLVAFLLAGLAGLVGFLFLLESRFKKLKAKFLYFFVILIPLTIFLIVTIYFFPLLKNRIDNGDYGEQLIQGNGIELIWAPLGPGFWSDISGSREAGELLVGDNPSWNEIAFYGKESIGFKEMEGDATVFDMENYGLCRYLSEDGLSLMSEVQDIWRMPTVNEIIGSLISEGENAGCIWDGESSSAQCQKQPNKDTPLWFPQGSVIYYWSGEEYNGERAWYVPYTGGLKYGGMIYHQSKDWGNPRHGFRCVKEL